MLRKQNFQSVAWFWDIFTRKLLDLDPPYQRRSVWNQSYREYFIDTVLQGYPSPAIFLFENITPEGQATYHVVDGKQRLSTLFAFIHNDFPVHEGATKTALRGLVFKELPDDVKKDLWSYQFTVEYLASDEEAVINNIFDRINRNTARLTPQELRHAKFNGVFISKAEDGAERLLRELGENFPHIMPQQRRQMKDVELTASLFLLLEEGPQGYSAAQLDERFSDRDEDWPNGEEVIRKFDATIERLKRLLNTSEGNVLRTSRLRNQADFYSLFGAAAELPDDFDWETAARHLKEFLEILSDDERRVHDRVASAYYEAARSASNDPGPRKQRIDTIKRVLQEGSP